ncbi:MAG: RluA family pseudouridine synthase [Candidatus Omnitrophica bacterium]|nr:RluA family pseudouridine synthase [Candidatus Omnitrophota bacterium]
MNEPFQIVFNDEYLIVINKLAKILVHPSPRKERYTLTTILSKSINEEVYPCHRLDRQTSGLIIYAKSKGIQKKIMEEFIRREVKKKYIAFIKGRMPYKKGLLKDYILDREGKIFGEKRKQAVTEYRVLNVFDNFSILELMPITGRTNQLRIQLAKIGNPILGESKYAFRRDFYFEGRKINFRRLALHAYFISFIHPIRRERVNLKVDLPEDMRRWLEKMQNKFN